MILVNGVPAESIPATDRGLAYGDGVFRTLRARHGEPLHWPRHYAKLSGDCVALGIACPDEALLLADVHKVACAHPDAVIKIIVTRGSGARGYAPPSHSTSLRVVMASPRVPALDRPNGIKLHLCRLRLAHQPALAGVKHLNRLENVLARAEWTDAETDEGLLLDQDGYAIGGTMSNLFIVEQGTLLTPQLSQCGVTGVTRARVLDIAENSRLACHVMPLPLQRVVDADEVFLVNSVIGLWRVARLGERQWPPSRSASITSAMRQSLEAGDAGLA
jgi:4-amino-4-deoxychorismate lyase